MGDDRIHLVARIDRGLQFVALLHNGPLRRGQIDMVGYAGDQLFVVERLGDVVAGPQLEAFDDVFGVVERREEDHRNVLRGGVGLEVLDHFVTVQIGHHDVEQDQVRSLFRRFLYRFVTARRRDDLVLGAAQHGFQQHDVGRDVIDGEDRVILRFYGDVFHGERLFTMQI